ncbi:MAG: hypothetical protein K1X29_07210 [Bdellovibrionales bacterium]|nr:hypothetical protein [Bdellovibrionales bacterium]
MSAFLSVFARLSLLGLFLFSLSSSGDQKIQAVDETSYLLLIESTLNEIAPLLRQGEVAKESEKAQESLEQSFSMGIDPLSGSNIFETLIEQVKLLLRNENINSLSQSRLVQSENLKKRIIEVTRFILENQSECERLTHEMEKWSLKMPVEAIKEGGISRFELGTPSRFILTLEESIKSCSDKNDKARRQRDYKGRGRSETGTIDCDGVVLSLFKLRHKVLVDLKEEADRKACIKDYNQFKLKFDLMD